MNRDLALQGDSEIHTLYNSIFDELEALCAGKIDEVIVTFNEMALLDYVQPSYWGTIGTDGNCYGFGIDGMYNNMADVLRSFAQKNNLVQTIDNLNNRFIFRK